MYYNNSDTADMSVAGLGSDIVSVDAPPISSTTTATVSVDAPPISSTTNATVSVDAPVAQPSPFSFLSQITPKANASPIQSLETAVLNEQLQSMIKSAYQSIDALSKIDSTNSTNLQKKYTTLIQEIQLYTTKGPIISTDILNTLRPIVVGYDNERDTIINTYVSESGDFRSAVMTEFKYYCKIVTYILGPILGFIIMTNTFFDEKFTFKIFYGFFGALWYPITVLFALFVPPVWRALFIPLVKTDLPISFFEFWKYNVTIDLDQTAKSQIMMRLVCIGFVILFGYSFLV